jgi:hypothetical protein
MNIPTPFEKFHWTIFNFLSRRLLGIGFILLPLFILLTVFLDLEKKWYSGDVRIIIFVLMPIVVIIGYLLIKSEPYYPKKYHEYFRSIGKIR